jgi:hypothetical protein
MKRIHVLAGVLVALLGGMASAGIDDDGDWQVWVTVSASHKAGDWRLKVEEEIYFGDDAGELFYRHTDVSVSHAVPGAKWLELGVAFREIQKENSKEEWMEEYRPRLQADMKFAPGGWYIRGRSRLELRCKTYSEEKVRFRERILVGPPAKWFGNVIQPYLGDEIYVEEEDGLSKNRIYAGVEATMGRVKTAVVYLLESSDLDEDDTTDVNVLQIELKIEV